MRLKPGVSLGDLTKALGGQLLGPPDQVIEQIAPLDAADQGCISFLAHPKYKQQLQTTAAGCVIVSAAVQDEAAARGAAIVVPDPYVYFARLTQWWAARVRRTTTAGIHPTALIDASAKLGQGVSIGPYVVIEADAELGDGVVLGAHCVVQAGARIGQGSRLAPRVTVGFDCTVGARCIVHSGVVIGADGFGFAPEGGEWVKIEQLGIVIIGDDVEIGANTCVDRGALGDTVLERGVKLDNLVQIGHNVRVGANTAMAGCVGIAGSATIGANCAFGGGAIVLGHLTVADKVTVSAASIVTRSLHQSGLYTGFFPLDENASWEKNAATVKNLHGLRERVRNLEKDKT
jgi:UDP-3-O-[3-hydroxymyristoyl] glucosamine N-acyltransferase